MYFYNRFLAPFPSPVQSPRFFGTSAYGVGAKRLGGCQPASYWLAKLGKDQRQMAVSQGIYNAAQKLQGAQWDKLKAQAATLLAHGKAIVAKDQQKLADAKAGKCVTG